MASAKLSALPANTSLADGDLLYHVDVSDTGDGPSGSSKKATALTTKNYVLANQAYVCVQDQKTSGTAGGTFTSGSWQQRTLNTIAYDTSSISSLLSNTITLAIGTYQFRVRAPGFYCEQHQARITVTWNSGGNVSVIYGTSEKSAAGLSSGLVTSSEVVGQFTITTSGTVIVEHRCGTTRATDGLGYAGSFGAIEVYTIAEFWRVP